MPSAEQHLKDAWKHVDHAHAEHTPARLVEIRNHVVDEQSKQKRPHDPVMVVACSCGERVELLLQDVYDATHELAQTAAVEAEAPALAPPTK